MRSVLLQEIERKRREEHIIHRFRDAWTPKYFQRKWKEPMTQK